MTTALSLTDRLEREFLRAIMRLPTGLVLKALGKKPIVIEGQTLHPEMQLCLVLNSAMRQPGMGDLSPIVSRKRLRRNGVVHGIDVSDVASKDIFIPMEDGHEILARHFRPALKSKERRPLLVYLHGGGYTLGDVEMFDTVCRYISYKTGFHVLSIDYRLAPEHPFPVGLNDSLAAFKWAVKNAEALGADPKKVAIGGDSAGANFSTIISQILVEKNEPAPALQLLIYPSCDRSTGYRSEELFAEGLLLTKRDLAYFMNHYTSGLSEKEWEERAKHPWISPLHAKSLSGLPPAVIATAGFDMLRDEGEAYAKALNGAGTEATLLCQEGMIHGFINMIGFSPAARKAFDSVLDVAQKKLS